MCESAYRILSINCSAQIAAVTRAANYSINIYWEGTLRTENRDLRSEDIKTTSPSRAEEAGAGAGRGPAAACIMYQPLPGLRVWYLVVLSQAGRGEFFLSIFM